MRAIALASLLVLVSALVAGCIFSPDKGDDKPPPPPTYPALTSPGQVLVALRLAYEARDSSGYRALFEWDYKGSSYDTSEADGAQAGTFTRIAEEQHIRRLAENPYITSVDLFLPEPWTYTRIIGDTGEEWVQIQVKNPQIGVTDGPNTVQTIANETFLFAFRPTYAPESPTDTLWHIVRWEEAP
jgi:hypothetical protein